MNGGTMFAKEEVLIVGSDGFVVLSEDDFEELKREARMLVPGTACAHCEECIGVAHDLFPLRIVCNAPPPDLRLARRHCKQQVPLKEEKS